MEFRGRVCNSFSAQGLVRNSMYISRLIGMFGPKRAGTTESWQLGELDAAAVVVCTASIQVQSGVHFEVERF